MSKINVGVIDYGIGNVRSIINALEGIGSKPILTSDKNVISQLDSLILPGVGAFKKGMDNLMQKNLIDTIYKFVDMNKPLLGICLGMQMLLEQSDEFEITKGLGLIKGFVSKMPIKVQSDTKLPHVGWNTINFNQKIEKKIYQNIENNSDVYFVHSYVANPIDKSNILSTTEYDNVKFCSSLNYKNIYGVQFHPEKSGIIGLNILKNFINISNN